MLLAKEGVDVNQASHFGHAEVVSMLLAKQGVEVNQAVARDNGGQGGRRCEPPLDWSPLFMQV